jgi:hypothetical protein
MSVKLVIPYIGELKDVDVRVANLAEFLGIPCETIALANTAEPAEFLKKSVTDESSCFAVNPQVLKEWAGPQIPSELAAFLVSRFKHLVVYGLRVDSYDSELVSNLSKGRLKSVEAIDGEHNVYTVADDSRDICEAFAGLSFGPIDPVNDHVLRLGDSGDGVRKLVSIGDRPLMALVKDAGTEILFLASEGVADLNTEIGDLPLTQFFSRFVAYAMALRYVAGEECWRPGEQHASIIIDDPLLRPNYGFLNFEKLLALMKQHNFQTIIAFIPYNCRRSSPSTAKAFRENPDRLAICFHGNDHTGAEFASTDAALLNSMLHTAERRMDEHRKRTGLDCDRVMVFPQGRFSVEAMALLKAHNFDAAVNSGARPMHTQVALTIGELAQPAVLRFEGFPLFLRKYSARTESADIAFNLFFGKPNFVVEHHDIFQDPSRLIAAVSKINAVALEVHWSSVGKAVSSSILRRRSSDGVYQIRGYARRIRVTNTSDRSESFLIEWNRVGPETGFDGVLRNGTRTDGFEADAAGVRGLVNLDAGATETFSLIDRNTHTALRSFGFRHRARAFVRRRLSEVRDNVISKNPPLLALAKTVQKQFRR